MPIAGTPSDGGFSADLTAGSHSTLEGYMDDTLAALFGASSFGSLSDTASPDGGIISGLYWTPPPSSDSNLLMITEDGTGVSTITIDGTDYTLTFNYTVSGYDFYQFSDSTQRIFTGNTYEIGLV
jgi:hypothetical protein